MSKPSEVAAYGALVTTAVVWGGSIVGQKFSLGSFSAVEVSVLRGLGALAILIPLWWWREGGTVRFSARDWGMFFILGLGVLGNHLLTLFGLRYIGAAAAGVIIGASPVITALLSSLLIRDVPFSAVWAGCALSFAGVALVSIGGGDAVTGENPWLGGVLILLGLASWALYSIGGRRTCVISKRSIRASRLSCTRSAMRMSSTWPTCPARPNSSSGPCLRRRRGRSGASAPS